MCRFSELKPNDAKNGYDLYFLGETFRKFLSADLKKDTIYWAKNSSALLLQNLHGI